MSLSSKRNKDQAMAQYMKEKGITRTACNCPICHGIVSLNRLYAHIITHG
jgi:hypothetical protein